MAVQLVLRNGTSAENDAFTGATGEVTVDTTNNSLRVHDGSTAGGSVVGKDFSAGTGITLSGTVFSIGQAVGTGDDVTFNTVTSNLTGNVTGTVSDISNHDTDDLSEGTTNLYYTDTRVRNALSASGDLSYNSATGEFSVTVPAGYDSSDFDTDFNGKSTDDLSEGSSNLYYTDTRVRNAVSATGDLTYDSTTGAFGVTTYKTSDFDTDFSGKTSDDLSEGTTNLYYTDARVDAHLSGGTGVTFSNGVISIGQSIETTDNVTFNNVNVSGTLSSDDISAATVTASNDLIVQGDLTVNGTTTTTNSTEINTTSATITLVDGLDENTAPSQNAGLVVNRGSSPDKTFLFDEGVDKWTLGTETLIAGTVEADVIGTVSDISNHDTDDLTEGASNLYFTTARVDAHLSGGNAIDFNAGTISVPSNAIGTDELNVAGTGSAGEALLSDGDGSFSFGAAGATITDDTATNSDFYPTLTGSTSGSFTAATISSTKLFFNPSSGTLNATSFNSLSDERTKKNIETLDSALDKTLALRGVSYTFKDTDVDSIGLIAQELEQVIPEVVSTGDDGLKSVSYGNLVGLLVEAIKDQQNQIDDLKNKVYK